MEEMQTSGVYTWQPGATRFVTIRLKRMFTLNDLRILYRIIRISRFAKIKRDDEEAMAREDLAHPVATYRFVVRDPIYLNDGLRMMHSLIKGFTSIVDDIPDEKFTALMKKTEEKRIGKSTFSVENMPLIEGGGRNDDQTED